MRGLHVNEIHKANKLTEFVLTFLLPNNRAWRFNISQIIKFIYFILIGVHYLICLFIWIGDKHLMNDPGTPWLLKYPELSF